MRATDFLGRARAARPRRELDPKHRHRARPRPAPPAAGGPTPRPDERRPSRPSILRRSTPPPRASRGTRPGPRCRPAPRSEDDGPPPPARGTPGSPARPAPPAGASDAAGGAGGGAEVALLPAIARLPDPARDPRGLGPERAGPGRRLGRARTGADPGVRSAEQPAAPPAPQADAGLVDARDPGGPVRPVPAGPGGRSGGPPSAGLASRRRGAPPMDRATDGAGDAPALEGPARTAGRTAEATGPRPTRTRTMGTRAPSRGTGSASDRPTPIRSFPRLGRDPGSLCAGLPILLPTGLIPGASGDRSELRPRHLGRSRMPMAVFVAGAGRPGGPSHGRAFVDLGCAS